MYHFHNYSNYSILANLLAAPIVSFIIMPAVVLTFLLMPLPFKIYKLSSFVLNFGITLMLKIAHYVSALPKAIFITPTTHIIVPILFTAGLLWFCIWEKRWRVFGVVPVIISFAIIILTPFPDIIIDSRYKAVLINNETDRNALAQLSGSGRISSFHKTQWFNLLTTNQKTIITPIPGATKIVKGVYRIKSKLQNLPNMCIRNKDKKELVKLIVTNIRTNETFVIFREDIEEYGSHFIYLNNDKIKIKQSINKIFLGLGHSDTLFRDSF